MGHHQDDQRGTTYTQIFDDQNVISIGAIAIAPGSLRVRRRSPCESDGAMAIAPIEITF